MSFIERLFVGYSFDKKGPYFILDDIMTQKRERLYFDSKTMSIEKTDKRFCIGTYDLDTFITSPCTEKKSLDSLSKENHCDICQYKIGFNPAFYNTTVISPQQERYNSTSHVVYMAYFSPSHIKVGIASEKRHSIRLLEQGALAAIILKKFPNAYLARKLESELCSKKNILEVLNSETKLKLLTSGLYNYDHARKVLKDVVTSLYENDPEGSVIDLFPYYFYGQNLSSSAEMFCVKDKNEIVISGKLMGMIGEFLIISQSTNDNILFPISLKKYISYLVKIYFDKTIIQYYYEPKQLSFWDIR
jgi:hypothetical protein